MFVGWKHLHLHNALWLPKFFQIHYLIYPHKTVLPLPPGIIIPIVKLRKEKQKGFKKLAEDHTVIK